MAFSNLEIFVGRFFADIVDEDLPASFAVAERFVVSWGAEGLVTVAGVAALPVRLGRRRLVLVVRHFHRLLIVVLSFGGLLLALFLLRLLFLFLLLLLFLVT